MKAIFFAVALGILASNAWAGDSTWYLCDNGKFALNLLEHRSTDGSGRAFSVALMYGAHVLQAEINVGDSNFGTAKMTTGNDSFDGTVSLGLEPSPNAIIDGKLTIDSKVIDVDVAVLNCKILGNNLTVSYVK